MNFVNNIVSSHKKLMKIVLIFIFISLFLAFFVFTKLDNSLIISNVKNMAEYLSNNNLNFIFNHFISISLIITLSLTIVGLIFIPIYLFYEVICILYSFYIFVLAFSIKGFIYALFFNLITKGFYIFFLLIIIRKIKNIVVTIYKYHNKENIDVKYSLIKNIKAIIVSIILIIISDIFIYFIGTTILLKLTFIL